MRCLTDYGKLVAPLWSTSAKKSVRSFLPMLSIGGKTAIKLNSGVYYLTIKYEEEQPSAPVEAAVIIGEIAFDNTGSVLAPGAKWKSLLGGETQKEGRTPPSTKKWYTARVSERWTSGDYLRFKIDTNTNTIVYTLTASGAKEAKVGWKFDNVLTFTSLPTNKKDIRAFAYCGGKGRFEAAATAVKLTIVDETPSQDSISTITEENTEAPPAEKPETAPVDILAETDAEPVAAE